MKLITDKPVWRTNQEPLRDKLHTARIVLKRLEVEDASALLVLVGRNRDNILRHFGNHYKNLDTEEQTVAFIKWNREKWKDRSELTYGVWVKDMLGGVAMIKSCDWWHSQAYLAYYMDKSLHGQGIMTEVIGRLLEYCFEDLLMEKVKVRTAPENLASQKVALNNGFVFEGKSRREFRRASGEIVDIMNYGIIREDYLINSKNRK